MVNTSFTITFKRSDRIQNVLIAINQIVTVNSLDYLFLNSGSENTKYNWDVCYLSQRNGN